MFGSVCQDRPGGIKLLTNKTVGFALMFYKILFTTLPITGDILARRKRRDFPHCGNPNPLSGEVSGRCVRSLKRQDPCLGPECPMVLSPALPSASMSSPSGFNGRLSPRQSSGGEPDEYGSITQAQPALPIITN
jgi:hypothetical protein